VLTPDVKMFRHTTKTADWTHFCDGLGPDSGPFAACKNSSPTEKSTHVAFPASSGAPPGDDSMFLNFQDLMKFKVFLAAKLPL
jgi:hypothetical protein